MSEKIQEQILKMSLDTNEFDKYAKQTIETLGKFEQQIDHLVKNNTVIDLGSKMISGFRDVTTTIDKVGRKYSWLEQIAVGAYRKIGEAAAGYLKNEVFKITGLSQATEGWRKYEQEVGAVQTIMNATDLDIQTVEKHLKKLSWYTDETSYHYDDMVQNIAAFNSAGVKDLGKATDAMIGIANMAGYFGVNANKATHAMEGFASAMGKGFMDNLAWERIHTAQMDTAKIKQAFVDTAVELKKLKKVGDGTFKTLAGHEFTYEQFNTMLRDKWLDQEVMIKTFGKYSKSVDKIYNAWLDSGETATVSSLIREMGDSIDETSKKAFKASQETKTFTDAVGAFEEVVASGWRTTFKYLFGNYEEATKLWSGVVDELWDLFAGAGYKRNDLLRGWYEGGGREEALKGIANIWYGLKAIVDPIKEAFDTIFPGTTVERLLELTHAFEQFSEKFRSWFDFSGDDTDELEDTLTEVTETTETFDDACERTRKNLDKLYKEVNAGKWGTMWDRWKALGEAGYVWQIVQNEVNKRYTEAGVGNYPTRYDVVDDGTVKLKKKTIEVLKEEKEAVEELTDAQKQAQKRSNNLMRTMAGLFSAISIGKDILGETAKFFGKTFGKFIAGLGPTIDSILEVTSKWGDELVEIRNNISTSDIAKFFEEASSKAASFASGIINKAIPTIITGVGWLTKRIRTIGDVLYPIVKVVIGGIFTAIKELPGLISRGYKKAKPFFDDIKNSIQPTINAVKSWINNTAMPFIKALPNTIGPFIKNTYSSGKKFITDVWGRILGSEGLAKLKTSLKSAWSGIKSFGTQVWDYLKEIGGSAWESISSFFGNYTKEDGGFNWAKLFADALDFTMGKISVVIEGIGDMIARSKDFLGLFNENSLADGVSNLVANVGETTEGLDQFAENRLEPIRKTIEDLVNWAKGITDILKDPIDYVLNGLKHVFDSILGFFEDLNLEKLASIFKDTGIGMFFGVLAKNMATGAVSIASIPSNFSLLLKSLADTFGAYQKGINAKAILNIAKAFGILTLAIIALSSVPPETLADITSYITVIGLVTALLVRMLALFEEHKKVQDAVADAVKMEYNFDFNGENMVNALIAPLTGFFQTLGVQIGKNFRVANTTMRIIALAASAMIIFKTVKDVYEFSKEVDKTEDGRARLYTAIGFVAATMVFLTVLASISKMFDNKATIGGALSFVTMALAIQLMMTPIKDLASMSMEELKRVGFVILEICMLLIGIAGAIALSNQQFSKFKTSDGDKGKAGTKGSFFGVATILIGLAAALRLMTPAFKEISNFGIGQLGAIGAVMLGIVAVVAIMASLAVQIGQQEGLYKGLGGIFLMTAMATALLGVFTILGKIVASEGMMKTIGVGLLAFAAGIAVIAAAAWILGKVSPQLNAFAEAVGKFGFGIIAGAAAIYIFAKALPSLVDGVIAVGRAFTDQETSAAFTAGVIAIGLAILAAWAVVKVGVIGEMFNSLKLILGKLTGFLKDTAFPEILKVLTTIVSFFQSHQAQFIAIAIGLIILIFDVLDGVIPNVVDRLFKLLLIIINSLAKTILVRVPQLFTALLNVLKAVLAVLSKALASIIGGGIGAIFGKKAGEKASNAILEFLIGPDGMEGVEKGINTSIAELKNQTDKYENETVDTINTAKKNIKQRTSGGLDISDAFGLTGGAGGGTGGVVNPKIKAVMPSIKMPDGGIDLTNIIGDKNAIFATADEAFSGIPDALKNNLGIAEMDADSAMLRIDQIFSTSGAATGATVEAEAAQTIANVNQTVDEGMTHTATVVDENGNTVTQEVSGYWADLAVTEEQGVKNHVDRMYNIYSPEVQEKLRQSTQSATTACLVDPMLTILNSGASDIADKADFIISGFTSRLKSQNNLSKVWSAGSGIVKHLMGSIDRTAEIASPSKAAGWRGLMIVTGFVNEIMNGVGQAEMAGTTLATRMLSSVSTTIENSGNLTPTITPVLSMGNVRTNLNTLNGLFGQSALSASLAANAIRGFDQNQEIKQAQIENFNMSNTDVVSQLQQLRGDVNSLNDAFSNTQVVLDSGALVGATARQMDNALGRINTYRGRGI